MREGLKVIQITGNGYYGYAVTLVGWIRRVSGDEYELLPGARVVFLKNRSNAKGLDRLAAEGPGKFYGLLDPTQATEELNRFVIRRCLQANEDAWTKECPQPTEWNVA